MSPQAPTQLAHPVSPLRPDELRWSCQPEQLSFAHTGELPDLEGFLGQPRALAAVEFGVGIRRDGYNLFAFGPQGTGKETLIRELVGSQAAEREAPPDLCYVFNFDEPREPRLLSVPAGVGSRLRKQMETLAQDLRRALDNAFENEEYQGQRRVIDDEFSELPQKALAELNEEARKENLSLLRTPVGLAVAPTENGEVLPEEEFKKLPEKEQKAITEKVHTYQEKLQKVLHQLPRWERNHHQRLQELNREVTRGVVEHLLVDLRTTYAELPGVLDYLNEVQQDIVEHARELIEPRGGSGPAIAGLPIEMMRAAGAAADPLRRYQVNLLVDHGETRGAPVICEENPTYDNLLGRIEHSAQLGALVTDFTLIRAGALHRANGGYLVLDALRLLRAPFAWEALKRALMTRKLRLEPLGQALSLVSTVSLEPEPLALDVQIVLLGEPTIYYLLWQYDQDFRELFKVAADFDDHLPVSPENLERYARLLATLARREELPPLSRGAVARLLEESSRLAGEQGKLSARFAEVSDLVKESGYWARRQGASEVGPEHVREAVEARIYRADRLRERLYEEIGKGTFMIDTEGAVIGQINGLSVMTLGGFSFGRPSRITARVRLGQDKVLDIEREVELGGPLHSKGVLILSSCLSSRYAPDEPPALAASLVFEQSYGGIDGDSASSAELYALLSALARVPLRQDLAVTGSVNQRGQVQAIGGVNEKIESFFDICKARELTGRQGVLIPRTNVRHLMLRPDVVAAVAAGSFHIYPVSHIDEGLELLTGMSAPDRDESGAFPAGTFNHRVAARLAEFSEIARKHRGEEKPAAAKTGTEGEGKEGEGKESVP